MKDLREVLYFKGLDCGVKHEESFDKVTSTDGLATHWLLRRDEYHQVSAVVILTLVRSGFAGNVRP